jgi:hypothetical protein
VLVVMALVGSVPVPVVDVVRVVAVRQGFMPAAVAVCVRVLLMSDMRQGMFVIMIPVDGVRVPLMDVVNMTLVRGGGVPALWPVDMVMPGMDIVAGRHGFRSPRCGWTESRPEYPRAFRGKPERW